VPRKWAAVDDTRGAYAAPRMTQGAAVPLFNYSGPSRQADWNHKASNNFVEPRVRPRDAALWLPNVCLIQPDDRNEEIDAIPKSAVLTLAADRVLRFYDLHVCLAAKNEPPDSHQTKPQIQKTAKAVTIAEKVLLQVIPQPRSFPVNESHAWLL
jgi:hypothetical protein